MRFKKVMDSYLKELLITLFVIIFLYTLGIIFWRQILDFLIGIPFINPIYHMLTLEIERRSIFGLSAVTFIGSLFFIGYPGDLLYLVYVKVGYSIFLVSLVMLIWMMIAQLINYGIGYFIERKLLEKFVKERKSGFSAFLKKYDFRKSMLYTLIGRILHFLFIILLLLIVKKVSLLL